MEAIKIEVIKNWAKLKSVYNISIFLGFANFYQRFIQGFSKIVVPFISILKTIRLPNKPASSKNNGSKSASSRNNNSRQIFKRNDGNDEVDGFDVSGNSVKHAKKLRKLSKLRKSSKLGKSKNEKTSKF